MCCNLFRVFLNKIVVDIAHCHPFYPFMFIDVFNDPVKEMSTTTALDSDRVIPQTFPALRGRVDVLIHRGGSSLEK